MLSPGNKIRFIGNEYLDSLYEESNLPTIGKEGVIVKQIDSDAGFLYLVDIEGQDYVLFEEEIKLIGDK
jgi:hypothetical protein